MQENNQPLPEDSELSDAELDLVSGGDQKQPPKTSTAIDGYIRVPGIKGPSKRDGHDDEIEIHGVL